MLDIESMRKLKIKNKLYTKSYFIKRLVEAGFKVDKLSEEVEGKKDYYWRIVKNAQGRIIVLSDNAANILKRIEFYDKDSRRIERHLTDEERQYYLKDIKEDITYFRRTYKRADIILDIAGLDPNQAARKVKETVTAGGDVR